MATIFTRILEGELPGTFVWRDPACCAFLSINPLQRGHTLVVPRAEVDHWLDLEPDLAAHLMQVSRNIGQTLQRVFSPVKVGLMIAGLEVPHTHLHVVPIRGLEDMDFANAAASVDREDLAAAGDAIRADLLAHGHAQAQE